MGASTTEWLLCASTLLVVNLMVAATFIGLLARLSGKRIFVHGGFFRLQDMPRYTFNAQSETTPAIVRSLMARVGTFNPWLHMMSSMLQSLLYGSGRSDGILRERQEVTMKDGGTVALDWLQVEGVEPAANAPIAIILGGLTSHGHSEIPLAEEAHRKGFRAVIFIKRGHGIKLTTPRLQAFGETADLRACINLIAEKFPDVPQVAIGISAGSAVLASYLGEHCCEDVNHPGITLNPLAAAALISPGFDLKELFGKPIPFPYNDALVKNMKNQILQPNLDVIGHKLDVQRVMSCGSVAEVDEHVYSKLNGYDNLEEYWDSTNPMRGFRDHSKLHTVPCFCLCAQDDPICRGELINYDIFAKSHTGILCTTKYGGHCGWFEQLWPRRSWANRIVLEYLIEQLSVYRSKNLFESSLALYQAPPKNVTRK